MSRVFNYLREALYEAIEEEDIFRFDFLRLLSIECFSEDMISESEYKLLLDIKGGQFK